MVELKSSQNRLDYFDIVKGITILAVVYVHSGASIGPLKYFVSYYMPLFFVISGYFIKQRSIVDTLKRGLKQLLLPFYVSGILGTVIAYLIGPSQINISRFFLGLLLGPVESFGGAIHCLWFFYALFWSRLIFSIFDHYFSTQIGILLSIILFVLSIRLQVSFNAQSWVYYLHGFSAVLFLYIGRLCRLYKLFDRNISYILIIIFMWACAYSLPNIHMDQPAFGDTLKDALLASLMSIGTILLVKKICSTSIPIVRGCLYFFRKAGCHSLLIYSIETIVFICGFRELLGSFVSQFISGMSFLWDVCMGCTRLFIVLAVAFIVVKLQGFIKQNAI